LKQAEAPPPSYPGLPGAVTKAPDWALKSTPFDVAAYFTAPADNAAPLYLDALFEFAPEDMKHCLSAEEVARREPNAKARAQRASKTIDAYRNDPKSVPSADADALVSEFEPALKLLATAQERKKCVFETGVGHLTQLAHLNAARTAGIIIAMHSASNLRRGDIDRAIADAEILLRLSRDVRSRGGAVGGLVSMSLDRRVCDEVIPQVLAAPELTRPQCDRLLHAMMQDESEADIAQGIFQGEYILFRSLLRPQARDFFLELAAHPELDLFQGAVDARAYKVLADYVAGMTEADFEAQIQAINDWYRTLVRLAQVPRQQRDTGIQATDEEAMRSRSPQSTGPNPVLASFFPSDPALFVAIDRFRAYHRGAQCLIALRLWRLDHDAPPGDLETATKAAGMTAAPTDPFGNGPLKMTAVNGQTVVYSIGYDGQDDMALVECDPKNGLSKGDLVFRLPTLGPRAHSVVTKVRTWADKSGAHTIEAELIEVKQGVVRLKKSDGKIVALPLEKLSDADQKYVKEHGHGSADAP
jgi:hypothetical protein